MENDGKQESDIVLTIWRNACKNTTLLFLAMFMFFQGHFDFINFLQFFSFITKIFFPGQYKVVLLVLIIQFTYETNLYTIKPTFWKLQISNLQEANSAYTFHEMQYSWVTLYIHFFFFALTVCRGGWAINHHIFNFIPQELLVTYRVKKTW